MSSTASIPTLTLAAAKAATQACEAKAKEIGVPSELTCPSRYPTKIKPNPALPPRSKKNFSIFLHNKKPFLTNSPSPPPSPPGKKVNIAVVDSTTHLVHFARMGGAKLTSVPLSVDKAFTAAGHGLPTSAYREAVWPGGPAYGISGTNGGRFNVIGGGVPVRSPRGELLGAVGCSTGTPAQDEEVARAGVEAVERMVREEEEEEGRQAGSVVKAKL